MVSGFEGLDLNMFKLFMLLYADDIVIIASTPEEQKHGLKLFLSYDVAVIQWITSCHK